MVTRRTDARRRRVLSEEFVPTDESAVAGSKKPMQAYSYGANRRNQPKTTDLIPKRTLALSLFFALLIGIVAVVNVLAWYADPLIEVLGEAGARSFELSGSGTLANWFCSICLFLCAGVCWQLFLLRKHKRDDYGGMYRVWILMALMFVVASIDCAIDLRTISAKLFEHLTHRSLIQTSWLLMTIEMIVLALLVIRMLFEVRTSKVSIAAALLVWLGFVGCIVMRNIQIPESIAWMDQKVAYGNCILLGCVGSLAALTVYSRFVFLHAHGLIQLKVKKKKAVDDSEQLETTESTAPKQKQKTVKTTSKSKTKTTAQPVAATAPEPVAEPAIKKPKVVTQTKKTSSTKPAPSSRKTAQPKVVKQQVATPQSKPAAAKKPRAPQKVAQPETPAELDSRLEEIESIPMSKAERRRQRKLAKRAARQNKAA